jgi:hypothetical protein
MNQNELGQGNLHIPGWTAEASLIQVKYEQKQITASHNHISQVTPQFEDSLCRHECESCYYCTAYKGYAYCSDICMRCNRCRFELGPII